MIDACVSVLAAKLSQRPDVTYISVKGRPVDYARNCGVRSFLEYTRFTHLLFLDSDTEPPLDVVERLLALDAPLASGCYPVIMDGMVKWALLERDERGGYRCLKALTDKPQTFTVDAAGGGCVLIRRDVFDQVRWPWFKWIEHADGSQSGEDVYFFKKCNRKGLRVSVDLRVLCNHHKGGVNLTDLVRHQVKRES
jgi:hypothetical protein